jgi:hypothetical protein
MKLIDYLLVENFHENIVRAGNIIKLEYPEIEKKELNRVMDIMSSTKKQEDQELMIAMAKWYLYSKDKKNMKFEEVFRYLKNRPLLKKMSVVLSNKNRVHLKKTLMNVNISDFIYYDDLDISPLRSLSSWNKRVEAFLEEDLSDSGLEIYASHDDYDMYKIETLQDLEVPIVKNLMPWCVTKNPKKYEYGSFGGYGGPPYYAIMQRSKKKPVAMIVPKIVGKSSDANAFANDKNSNAIDIKTLEKIKPLLKMIVPKNTKNIYSTKIHDIELEKNLSPLDAYRILIGKIEPENKEELEKSISSDGLISYNYAKKQLGSGKRFKLGEWAIAESPDLSYQYAVHLGNGKRFELGENSIKESGFYSIMYAKHLGERKRFEPGEDSISKDVDDSMSYSIHIGDRFLKGEKAIFNSKRWEEYKYNIRSYGITPPDKPWEPGDPE